MLFPLLGAEVARRLDRRWVRRALAGTAVLVVAALAVVGTQVRFDWLHPVIAAVTQRDPDLEGIDWTSLRDELASRGLLGPDTIVGVPSWRDAGKIAYALGPRTTVLCLNRDARQFGFATPVTRFEGRDVLVLSLDPPDRAAASLAPTFDSLEPLPPVAISFAGRKVRQVSVFLGHGLRRPG
jgi:hypothetical protein